MKNLQAILREITELTAHIESNYPELYQYLDENPLTLKNGNAKLEKKEFANYLESLKSLLQHHLDHFKLMGKTPTK